MANRFANYGAVIGFIAGVMLGAGIGFVCYNFTLFGALIGAILACVPGAFAGILSSFVVAIIARIYGVR